MLPEAHGRCRAARYITARLHGWQFALQCCRLSWSLSDPVLRGQRTPLQEECPSKGPSHTWLPLQTTRTWWRTHPMGGLQPVSVSTARTLESWFCPFHQTSQWRPFHCCIAIADGHVSWVVYRWPPLASRHEMPAWCTPLQILHCILIHF